MRFLGSPSAPVLTFRPSLRRKQPAQGQTVRQLRSSHHCGCLACNTFICPPPKAIPMNTFGTYSTGGTLIGDDHSTAT